MKFKEKYKIEPGFEDLFEFKSKDEEIEHEAKMLMVKFLSEFEKLTETNPIKKKELAKALNTSPSYITQLFLGDKIINLMSLAKLQKAYNFTFEIKAIPNTIDYKKDVEASYENMKLIDLPGHWENYSKLNPTYSKAISKVEFESDTLAVG